MTTQPVHSDFCSDCGSAVQLHDDDSRCPACFDKHLFDVDVGFLESYRTFGARSRLIVAETCLRGLVTESPDHRKILAMAIFEQYIGAMNDLAALYTAFLNRDKAPILKSFIEYRLDADSAGAFFDSVRSLADVDLLRCLDLPLPGQVAQLCPHLSQKEQYDVSVGIYHLVQDLRKATDQGDAAALALAQLTQGAKGAVIASNARWLDVAGSDLPPDQLAMLVLDSRRNTLQVKGLTADENAMQQVVDAIDTATRAASNLVFSYLQINDL